MIAKIRCYAEKARFGLLVLSFIGTLLAGGWGAHQVAIAVARAETAMLDAKLTKQDEVITDRQDRMETQLWEELREMKSDIKTLLQRR